MSLCGKNINEFLLMFVEFDITLLFNTLRKLHFKSYSLEGVTN